jgi:integrase
VKTNLTQAFVQSLAAANVDVYDTQQPGLVLRTRSSGTHSYRVLLKHGQWYTLGSSTVLTPAAARELARQVLGDLAHGIDPREKKRKAAAATFDTFLEKHYEPWALIHLRSASSFLHRLKQNFSPLFGGKPLNEITPWAIERWRSARLRGENAVKPGTVNRDLTALKACLSKAVQWRFVSVHPLQGVKRSKEDTTAVVRFLHADEEASLRAALIARDEERRRGRISANDWRRERGYELLPEFGTYTDHLTPIVLLAINTGLRRGELLQLTWEDVDLDRAILTVRGEGAKSGKTRHVPLNAEAVRVLREWQGPTRSGLIFPGENGEQMTHLKSAWTRVAKLAKLRAFRFHDLRHTFASKLVQRGVDLNTVRELLGHSDFSLTLRYAHLAAENKAAAVAKLMEARGEPAAPAQPVARASSA